MVLRGPACRRACGSCLEPEEWRPKEADRRECRLPLRVVMDPLDACVVTESFDARTERLPAADGQAGDGTTAVVVAICPREALDVLEVVARRGRRRADVTVLPESFGLVYRLRRPALDPSEIPVYEPRAGLRRRASLAWKRVSDVVVAAALLTLLLPVLALVAVVIRLESPGSVIFAQERVGRRGRPFKVLKFRTMVADAHKHEARLVAESEADRRFVKITCDPRVTRIGRFLRKTSIDELPQLWNVIRGEMSLVGPRPSQPGEVAHYEPPHFERLLVRPGITGMWQVSGRSGLSFEEAVALDGAYVRDWSPSLDLRILARTALVVLQCRGAC